MQVLLSGSRTRRHDDRVRRATASLRGAGLAVATAAARLTEQLGAIWDCPDDDLDCISNAYADLLVQRRRVDDVGDELSRLERTPLRYGGSVPADAPRLGGEVSTVIAARNLLDRAHDRILEALEAARTALARADVDLLDEGAAS